MSKLTKEERAHLVEVLIYHQRMSDGGCACGWGRRPEHLGTSFAEHVVAIYEAG